MRENLNKILDKELSRRDFLKMILGAMVMFMGVHNLIAYIAGKAGVTLSAQKSESSHGFGSSKFGR